MILQSVHKNKRKTVFIVSCFFLVVALFIYFLSLWFLKSAYLAVAIGLSVSILMSVTSYYNSDKIVLSLNKARPASREEFLQLNVLLEGICIAANLPQPKLYIMEDEALNAFATGRNPEHSVICVTTGLVQNLDKYELEGVLAHELAHIKNYDILLSTIAIVMVGFIVIIADIFSRIAFRSNSSDSKGSGVIMLVGLFFIILSPIFATALKLAISRNREYLADATAVEFTRNKDGLIHALEKISQDSSVLEQANKSSASLFIMNPFQNERKKKNNFWSTHPNVENRIKALQTIQ